jgi:hypothetical protein
VSALQAAARRSGGRSPRYSSQPALSLRTAAGSWYTPVQEPDKQESDQIDVARCQIEMPIRAAIEGVLI